MSALGNGWDAALVHGRTEVRHFLYPRSFAGGLMSALGNGWNAALVHGQAEVRPGERMERSVNQRPRAYPFLIRSSAICTAFRAAPLRSWSPAMNRSRPLGWEISSRMRPTRTSSRPLAVKGIG